jgi:hypothetical protein
MATNIILGRDFLTVVCQALDINPNTIRRIIIDAKYDNVIIVYAEMLGTKELLKIDFGSYDMKVVTASEGEK